MESRCSQVEPIFFFDSSEKPFKADCRVLAAFAEIHTKRWLLQHDDKNWFSMFIARTCFTPIIVE